MRSSSIYEKNRGRLPFSKKLNLSSISQKREVVFYLELTCFHTNQKSYLIIWGRLPLKKNWGRLPFIKILRSSSIYLERWGRLPFRANLLSYWPKKANLILRRVAGWPGGWPGGWPVGNCDYIAKLQLKLSLAIL